MGFLDRTRTIGSPRTPRPAASTDGRTGVQLLEAADTAYALAEQEFDRSPETREELESAYLAAAHALDAERHPRRASAWLGLATVRRYQKGRRDNALEAYDAALTAGPDNIEIWEAYLDYITYAISAAALLAIVERMPTPVRAHTLPQIVSVGRDTDRWGTMPVDDQRRFTDTLPGLLEALDDRPSHGALLSTNAMDEYRNGSHSQARQLMRRAVATGHPSPACVDRLTIDLVKLGEKNDAATILRDALTRPIPSDSMRNRMTKRLARCTAGLPSATDTDTDNPGDDPSEVLDPAASTRHLRAGENAVLPSRTWRAQIGWHDPSNDIDVDVCALLLRSNGRVGTDDDMVFYNQLTSPDGSVRHGGEQTLGSADLFEELQVDLPAVPDHVDSIAVCASVHSGTFADVAGLHVRLEGDTNLVFAVPALSTERAVVLFEFYRRAATWKVRAIGQGYDDGLAGLARDFGVDVA